MKVLAISDYNENLKMLDKLLVKSILKNIDVILFAGNIIKGVNKISEWTNAIKDNRRPIRNIEAITKEIVADTDIYQLFYEKLIKSSVPTMLIPGAFDAPEKKYLSFIDFFEKTTNLNLIHRNLIELNSFIYMGFGGEIVLDEKDLENYFKLSYSIETIKYSLRKIKYRAGSKILMFHSAPNDREELDNIKIDEEYTSLLSIINEINPVLVVCAANNNKPNYYNINNNKGILVQPGKLSEGHYAIINVDNKKVKFHTL